MILVQFLVSQVWKFPYRFWARNVHGHSQTGHFQFGLLQLLHEATMENHPEATISLGCGSMQCYTLHLPCYTPVVWTALAPVSFQVLVITFKSPTGRPLPLCQMPNWSSSSFACPNSAHHPGHAWGRCHGNLPQVSGWQLQADMYHTMHEYRLGPPFMKEGFVWCAKTPVQQKDLAALWKKALVGQQKKTGLKKGYNGTKDDPSL